MHLEPLVAEPSLNEAEPLHAERDAEPGVGLGVLAVEAVADVVPCPQALPEPPPDRVAQAVPQRSGAEAADKRTQMWAEGAWGAFRFTWQPPADRDRPDNPQHGALQAFHRRSSVSACKKSISCTGPTTMSS